MFNKKTEMIIEELPFKRRPFLLPITMFCLFPVLHVALYLAGLIDGSALFGQLIVMGTSGLPGMLVLLAMYRLFSWEKKLREEHEDRILRRLYGKEIGELLTSADIEDRRLGKKLSTIPERSGKNAF